MTISRPISACCCCCWAWRLLVLLHRLRSLVLLAGNLLLVARLGGVPSSPARSSDQTWPSGRPSCHVIERVLRLLRELLLLLGELLQLVLLLLAHLLGLLAKLVLGSLVVFLLEPFLLGLEYPEPCCGIRLSRRNCPGDPSSCESRRRLSADCPTHVPSTCREPEHPWTAASDRDYWAASDRPCSADHSAAAPMDSAGHSAVDRIVVGQIAAALIVVVQAVADRTDSARPAAGHFDSGQTDSCQIGSDPPDSDRRDSFDQRFSDRPTFDHRPFDHQASGHQTFDLQISGQQISDRRTSDPNSFDRSSADQRPSDRALFCSGPF